MRSKLSLLSVFLVPLLLSACSPAGGKSASASVIYAAAAVISFLLLLAYCFASKKKSVWYLLLFSSVLLVNIGYYILGVSQTLETALMANRIAYFGSVFLPLSMYLIILGVTDISYRRWLPGVLLGISVLVLLVAASPGYLDIYYREVSIETVNGLTVLNKVYGPLHCVYMFYLLGYFALMVASVVYGVHKKKVRSLAHAVILAVAVFVNIGVWFIEQLVRIDFEMLSVSYIISECFLLGLDFLIAEQERSRVTDAVQKQAELPPSLGTSPEPADCDSADRLLLEVFAAGIQALTPKEKEIYNCYVEGMTTGQIMESLNIKENTLKFHNKNLYGKLGVSSRKQLMSVHSMYRRECEEQK